MKSVQFISNQRRECEQFLTIRTVDGPYQTIDLFVRDHQNITDDLLNTCVIRYRDTEKPYSVFVAHYRKFTEELKFVSFDKPEILIRPSMRAAAYFIQKASDCLQTARFFIIKSALLLDTDYNIHWSQGYVPQFWFRCIYFGTAATWLSNTFDQILQAVYWAKELYTSLSDHGKPYDDSWDAEKIMKKCKFNFVTEELGKRGLKTCEDRLTSCYSTIEEVRDWANFIKHKGGLDYKFLELKPLGTSFFIPASDTNALELIRNSGNGLPDAKYELVPFKSPITIDIEERKQTLVDEHTALLHCINDMIKEIDFNKIVV